ncbi:hypothetical protein Zm00014a_002577 [Zea mays]|uniref:Uncharacterized protein n=2 Tax=Zea mays TaxID=4577 RepID=A0A3L6FHU2_MAIZE|nr:hypothetical protein ZEAMMB73_Zm00001d039980 [Zea mays]PWZ32378.1 hypothetical protein Zm00014a_002577 [Zea mays]
MLLMREADHSNITRLLLGARVIALEEVPHFIVFSVTEVFQGFSRTIQCDIIQNDLLGALPEDEEEVSPYPNNGQELPFDFFGLGQPLVQMEMGLGKPMENVGLDLSLPQA